MLLLALIVLVLAVASSARLAAVVRADRPLTTPRSHGHELPASARLGWGA